MVATRTKTFRLVVLTLWVLTWSNKESIVSAAASNRTSASIGISKWTAIVASTSVSGAATYTNRSSTSNSSSSSASTTAATQRLLSTKATVSVGDHSSFREQSDSSAVVDATRQHPQPSRPHSISSLDLLPTSDTAAPGGFSLPLLDSNCLSQMECDVLDEFEPPPDLVPFLPPPPLPASLFKSLALAYPSDQVSTDDADAVGGGGGSGGHSNAFLVAHRDICNLCGWANRQNDTETVTIPALGITQETTWISILVVASLTSAVVGAIFMIMLLKCRKFKILPMTDSCPILPDSYFGNKTNNNNHSRSNSNSSCVSGSEVGVGVDPAGVALNNGPKNKKQAASRGQNSQGGGGGGGGGTAANPAAHSIWNFWRRTSSSTERPLRSPGSLCSEENSYSEEPYVVSEHSSALYAELNSVSQDGNGAYRTYSMNTYSEVCDPNVNKKMAAVLCSPGSGGNNACHHTHHHHHHHHHRGHLLNDGTYENAAYVLSENTVECHHGCPVHSNPQQLMLQETDSLDTPSSSAYYSDSSNQNQVNGGRKRKKKQLRPLVATVLGPDDMNDEEVTETLSGNLPVINYYPALGGNAFNVSGVQLVAPQKRYPFGGNSLRVIVQQQPVRVLDMSRPLPHTPPPPPPMPPPPPIQTSTPIGTPVNSSGQQSPTFLSSSNRSSIRPLPPVPSQYV